mmetsp:Transcript_2496/g.5941  ORF Transcript_2496/g.5941 Transcript_2496/m.5941 type:complete len:507 (+) Transcript_2496:61-1581(+)
MFGKKKETKGKKGKGGFDDIEISAPSGEAQHKLHIDPDKLEWSNTEMFTLDKLLGEGAYGAVYLGQHKEANFTLAIKVVAGGSAKLKAEVDKEMKILRECAHGNVVRYWGCAFEGQKIWIMMDYCGAGSVADLLIKLPHGKCTENQIRAVIAQSTQGLNYLHKKGIIHRDIKSANILLTEEGEVRMADFGVSAQLENGQRARTTIGTPLWMSPEVLNSEPYDLKADIWSVGITAIEMGDGEPPYRHETVMRAMFRICSEPAPTMKDPSEWSPEFGDFLSVTLQKDPAERPDTAELMKHPFLAEYLDTNRAKEIILDMLITAGITTVVPKVSSVPATPPTLRESRDSRASSKATQVPPQSPSGPTSIAISCPTMGNVAVDPVVQGLKDMIANLQRQLAEARAGGGGASAPPSTNSGPLITQEQLKALQDKANLADKYKQELDQLKKERRSSTSLSSKSSGDLAETKKLLEENQKLNSQISDLKRKLTAAETVRDQLSDMVHLLQKKK